MPPAPYPDFRWFFRSLRALPVVAIAALVGGIIGGFSVFALDLALTTPPNREVGAELGKINGEKASESAAAAPAAGTSAPPVPQQEAASNAPPSVAAPQPVPQSQAQTAPAIAVTPPLSPQQTTWPDALSREHKSAPDAAASAASPPAAPEPPAAVAATPAAAPQAPLTQTARVPDSASAPPAKTEIARKPVPLKRRVATKKIAEPAANDSDEASTQTGQPVYDSYGRSDDASPADARARYEYSNRRYSVRHERAADDHDRSTDGDADADQSDGSDNAMPPQPAPPPLLFGLFGGGDRYDDR
jgi:hypothetical protein